MSFVACRCDSFRRQRIFLIARPVTAHPADCCQHWEQRVLHGDRWTRRPDEIAHLLQQYGPLQQIDIASRRQFAIAAEPELSVKEDLGRRQRRPVLVVDAQDAAASIPLAVGDADRTDERVSGVSDSHPIPYLVSKRPFQDDETLLLSWMDMRPDGIWAWFHRELRSEELPARRIGCGEEDEPLAGLRAIDLGADPDQAIPYLWNREPISALPTTSG